ncbi:glucose 1-dehydrogenase [Candidatus Nitrosocosmicus sp. SS]|uniref:glucose 1-dehydrogenase n=1 Tax=Candidatus Nitrosocosmicus agrestis TaxID=2563600 RepID=UPI001E3EC75F|nr:glucose 1-dehydrogenase [Candidatus Nitrosocosmicus sp. SS]
MTGSKIAVITGSSKGIGRAIAITFAKSDEYSSLVINSRKIEEAEAVVEEIKTSTNCDAVAILGDVSKEEDCIRLIKETVNKFGRIDVLVNNAGIQKDIPLTETTLQDWYNIISVDLTGPFICSREAVKQMQIQDPKGGCIINISSVHQIIPKPHYVPYATSKGGIDMMTKTMALELAADNIRVNIVAPGAIDTDMNLSLRTDEWEREKTIKKIPMGRIGKDVEVANVVDFLASAKASYITGSTFVVDGGMTLYPSFGLDNDHGSKHVFPQDSN